MYMVTLPVLEDGFQSSMQDMISDSSNTASVSTSV